jgi:hypothetical protein
MQLTLAGVVALTACANPKSEGAVQPAPEAANPYTIKIHRSFVEGQKLDVDVHAEQSAFALVGGVQESVAGLTEEWKLHLVGDVTIDQVADDGRAATATLHVVSFVHPDTQQVILPPDSIVLARRVDGVLIPELQGGTLSADQQMLLLLAFPLERPGSRLGDELFGTPDPRAVGDTWSFNRAYVVDDLREDGIASAETDIGGNVKLAEVVPCGKGECLKLNVDVTAKSASLVAVQGASDVGTGELASTIVLEVPVDPSVPMFSEEATTSLSFSARFQQGEQTIDRQITANRHRRAQYVLAN